MSSQFTSWNADWTCADVCLCRCVWLSLYANKHILIFLLKNVSYSVCVIVCPSVLVYCFFFCVSLALSVWLCMWLCVCGSLSPPPHQNFHSNPADRVEARQPVTEAGVSLGLLLCVRPPRRAQELKHMHKLNRHPNSLPYTK